MDKLDDKQKAIYHNLKVGNIYCYLYNVLENTHLKLLLLVKQP